MTGQAEDNRRVKADLLDPKLVNTGFEEIIGSSGEPTGWYYIRQMELITGDGAPGGRHYVTFTNAHPGRGCRALQGFAIDGRQVHDLELSCMVRGRDIVVGASPDQLPQFAIIFLDDSRAPIGQPAQIGPWRGTFDWQRKTGRIKVPVQAREGIVNIGLLGATGEVSYDDVQINVLATAK
jgi:protein-L-isoaspartate(D-aspartate) O-methyltransferase